MGETTKNKVFFKIGNGYLNFISFLWENVENVENTFRKAFTTCEINIVLMAIMMDG